MADHAGHHELALGLGRAEILDELEDLVCSRLASPGSHPASRQMLGQHLGHTGLLHLVLHVGV